MYAMASSNYNAKKICVLRKRVYKKKRKYE